MVENLNRLKFCCLTLILTAFLGCSDRSNPFDPASESFLPLVAADTVTDSVYINVPVTIPETVFVTTNYDTIIDTLIDSTQLPSSSVMPFYMNMYQQSPENVYSIGDTLAVRVEVLGKNGEFIGKFIPFFKITFFGEHVHKNLQLLSVEELPSHYEIKTLILGNEDDHRSSLNVELNFNQSTLIAGLTFNINVKQDMASTVRVTLPNTTFNDKRGGSLTIRLHILNDWGNLVSIVSPNDISIRRWFQGAKSWELDDDIRFSTSEISTGIYEMQISGFVNENPSSEYYSLEGTLSVPGDEHAPLRWGCIISGSTEDIPATPNPGTLNLTL